MFQLKQSIDEIDSSNHGITASTLRQVSATRDVTGAGFASGVQNYKFETSGNKWWVPSKSYMRLRCKLVKGAAGAGAPLTIADGIAPNMNLCGNLWQSMDFKIGDTTISRVSNNVAQVDTLKHRLEKSRAWSKSIGQSMNFWDEDFHARQNAVCSDGVNEDYKHTESLKQELPGYNVGDTIEYKAANNAVLTYINNQSTDLWKAGDLYRDYSNPISVPGIQLVETATLDASRKIWTLVLVTTPVLAASAVHVISRTRFGGSDARRVSEFELIWRPPLGIFDYEGALPSGNYQLSMTPQNASVIQNMAIESIGGITVAASSFNFSVVECFMYIQEYEGPNMTDSKYLLDLSQIRCQSVDFISASFGQRSFDVSPATRALTMAFQDARAGGSDTRISSSKFRMYDGAGTVVPPDAATKISNDAGLRLNRFYMSYCGKTYPPQDSDPEFKTNVDRTAQRYVESMMQSQAFFDTGGAEDIQEFHTAGSYYHQLTYKDERDQSTRVNVYTGLTGADVPNARVLLFDHHTILAEVTLENGTVKSVQVADL